MPAYCVSLLLLTPRLVAGAQPGHPPEADPSVQAQLQWEESEEQASGGIDGEVQEPPKPTVDLSSPRATMRLFLLAIQDAAGDHPERIDDAVKCLNISELEGEDRVERARLLARRLHSIIDERGVKLDDIPEKLEGEDYLFYQGESVDDAASPPEIRIARDPATGDWRFTALTVASIPTLEAATPLDAQSQGAAESKVPAARRSPRATMTTFLEAMNKGEVEEAVDCLDPAGQDADAWSVRGEDLAIKLKNVMDKIKLVVLTEIPDTPDGAPYVWYASESGNIVIGRIVEGEALVGEWRFTPKTLKTLDALYLAFEDRPIIPELQQAGIEEELTFGLWLQRRMPDWFRQEFLHLQGWQWLALAALLAGGWVVRYVAPLLATLLLWLWLRRRRIHIDRETRRRAVRSTGAIAAVIFWLAAVKYLQLQLPDALTGILLRILWFCLAVTAVWMGYRVVDVLGGHIAADKEIQLTRFDDVLIPLLRRILRLVVVLVVVLIVLAWMGQPPTTVLGALGIGGVALAFAAQDTLGNFFGSITVLFDRPFGIGDWIVIGDVEGLVEHVGFRSTRVRTFYNSMVTIPNSKMVNTQVDNYGARRYRRAKMMLSVTYSTPPEKIDAFCEGIRELIRLHPYTRKDYYHVYFNKFASSSLDILLYVFFEVPDWATELRERHRLLLDIMRLAERLKVEFAFPTQTVWLRRGIDAAESSEESGTSGRRQDPDELGLGEAARLYEEAYGSEPPLRGPVLIERQPRSRRSSKEEQSDQTGHA